ncbi:rCG20904, isoform CRA_c [Rattus norvegicus]|uniref:RCG20904, isoform CRA_c n=1 Tax=Rattus norvegicus TaxID=10116 RepID=A6JDJ2_RAT|nr:rCG20904, isoform CRA_c [Rattus norvegicus]EDL81385.1 rCG20904, isoform CRA_c [Rattus norvegicus]EDL81386.1 rCG20904, isoform CRA_c [Rattus norvegicus]
MVRKALLRRASDDFRRRLSRDWLLAALRLSSCAAAEVLSAAAAKRLARCLTPFCWYSLPRGQKAGLMLTMSL